jgi:predicted transcriptional regulator
MKKFNVNAMKPLRIKKKRDLVKIDPKKFLKNRSLVAKGLAEAIISGDQESFQEIIMGYLSVINKEELARSAKLPIATIRRVASGSNYNIETLLKITSAIDKVA